MTEPETEKYQVVIVKYGTRTTVMSDVFLNHHVYGEPNSPIEMDYFFWVIRNQNRTLLVDTGFSRAGGESRNRTFVLEPARAYAALGIDPADAPPLIVTHAHYDHIGNVDLFDQSPILLSANEYDFWTGRFASRTQFHHSVEDVEINVLAAAREQGRLTTFIGRHQVAPGIEVVEIGGHTPGQSVVLVDTSEGTVLLASDAIHYYSEYELDRPFLSVANLVDMYAGFDQIRAMLDSGEVIHLVTGHDPDTLARFTPLDDGELTGLAATIGQFDAPAASAR